jgi:hypothetical protein
LFETAIGANNVIRRKISADFFQARKTNTVRTPVALKKEKNAKRRGTHGPEIAPDLPSKRLSRCMGAEKPGNYRYNSVLRP